MTLTHPLSLAAAPRIARVGVGIQYAGQQNRWCLRDLWSLHLYTYHATLQVGRHKLVIEPGSAGLTPAGWDQLYDFPKRAEHLYVHFAPAPGPPMAAPLMLQLGARFAPLATALKDAVAWQIQAPGRAQARIWDLLWSIVGPDPAPRLTTPLARAQGFIEERHGESLSIPQIAHVAGCSQSHLGRLFQAATGSSIVAYVRQRRMERARHLLQQTDLPIAEIARSVGMPDLQAFNKTIRRTYGLAPRMLRSG